LIQTRVATISDAPELLEQLLEMHSEVPFGSVDEGKLRKHITHVLDKGIVYLSYAPRTGIVTGSCAFLLAQSLYWSSDWWATEQWITVRQEFRGSESASALLRKLRDLSDQLNVPVQFSNSSPVNTNSKNKLFKRYSSVELGSTFIVFPKIDKNNQEK